MSSTILSFRPDPAPVPSENDRACINCICVRYLFIQQLQFKLKDQPPVERATVKVVLTLVNNQPGSLQVSLLGLKVVTKAGLPVWIIVNDLCGWKKLLEGIACLLSLSFSLHRRIAAKDHHVRLHACLLLLHAGLKGKKAPDQI